MLHLILTNRNLICRKEQNISCHQKRVSKEPHIDPMIRIVSTGLLIFLKFGFIGMGPVEQALRGKTSQNPAELKNLRNIRLTIKDRSFWIQAKSQPGSCNLIGHLPEFFALVNVGQRMIVGNKQQISYKSPADLRPSGSKSSESVISAEVTLGSS